MSLDHLVARGDPGVGNHFRPLAVGRLADRTAGGSEASLPGCRATLAGVKRGQHIADEATAKSPVPCDKAGAFGRAAVVVAVVLVDHLEGAAFGLELDGGEVGVVFDRAEPLW